MKRIALLVSVALIAFILPGCGAPRTMDSSIQYVDLAMLRSAMEKDKETPSHLVIVDPRPASEYSEGHIPGSVNLRLPDVDRVEGLNPLIRGHHMIVVYGKDPGSAVAKGMTKKLISLQYKRVRMYQGGMVDWIASGQPVEK